MPVRELAQFTGERLWRVIFAWCSLPLAYSWIVYYIAHVHDGFQFWNLQSNETALVDLIQIRTLVRQLQCTSASQAGSPIGPAPDVKGNMAVKMPSGQMSGKATFW